MTDTIPDTQQVSKPRPRKRWLSPEFVQAMLAGHSALGLAFAAAIYIVCLTGTMCVFLHDFHRWEQPDAPLVTKPLSTAAIREATWGGHGQALIDGVRGDLYLAGPSANNPRFYVTYVNQKTHAEGEWVADENGHLATRVFAPWTDFLGELHMNLHLPRTWGMFLVGLTGVALLSSLVSGLLAHPRIFKDAFSLRLGGARRLEQADLHNRLGVWGLPFHFVVSLTGALLGLSVLIVGVLALAAYNGDSQKAFSAILGPGATPTDKIGNVPDIEAMIATIKKRKPDAQFVSAFYQQIATAGQAVNLGMSTPGHLAFSNAYYFDADGKLIGDGGLEDGGVGQQILGILQPLHFGWFGGLGTKIIYGVLGLALTFVAQNGVTIWLARRREKGRPTPVWERVWSAVVWGQPLAIAVVALASLRFGEGWPGTTYVLASGACVAGAVWASDAARVRVALQAMLATAVLLVALFHAWIWRYSATDPMSASIDAVLIVTSAAIAALAIQGTRGRRGLSRAVLNSSG